MAKFQHYRFTLTSPRGIQMIPPKTSTNYFAGYRALLGDINTYKSTILQLNQDLFIIKVEKVYKTTAKLLDNIEFTKENIRKIEV